MFLTSHFPLGNHCLGFPAENNTFPGVFFFFFCDRDRIQGFVHFYSFKKLLCLYSLKPILMFCPYTIETTFTQVTNDLDKAAWTDDFLVISYPGLLFETIH